MGTTSGWKTYRNAELGFEFRYPANWLTSVTEGEFPMIHFAQQGEHVDESVEGAMSLNISPDDLSSFVDNVHQKGEIMSAPKHAKSVVRNVPTFVGNKPAVFQESMFEGITHYVVVIPLEGKSIILVTPQRQKPLLTSLLSTFTFID